MNEDEWMVCCFVFLCENEKNLQPCNSDAIPMESMHHVLTYVLYID